MTQEIKNNSDILEQFCMILKELKSDYYIIKEKNQTIKIIENIIGDKKNIVITKLPEKVYNQMKNNLKGDKYTFINEISNKTTAIKILDRIDIGITWASYGIAEQGALIEVSYDDATKLSSCLPYEHIAFISIENIVKTLTEGLEKVSQVITNSKNEKPTISLISGPSKTGDIEMKILRGVHGPNKVHVLIIDY